MMNPTIDLVADLGEGFGAYTIADDAGMLALVSSANVACGFHAGDPRTMARAVELAVKNGVAVGAHPGFPDLVGFGRRDMNLTAWEITTDVLYQLGALDAFVKAHKGRLQHITPHGRLGNLADTDRKYAEAVLDAVVQFDPSLIIAAPEGELVHLGRSRGLKTAILLLGDRAYNDDGSLVSRSQPNAVIHDPEAVTERCVRMALEGTVSSITGRIITKKGDSLLLHGDTAGSLEIARKIRQALVTAGVEIRKLGERF
ncbi:MAG: 5-oxoprolinase subunit PxpA [Sporomusaceae bacterium]|nr:5-oxoprolinase subunit PxpA [Sporomusaceae bacterium]